MTQIRLRSNTTRAMRKDVLLLYKLHNYVTMKNGTYIFLESILYIFLPTFQFSYQIKGFDFNMRYMFLYFQKVRIVTDVL